MTLAALQHPLRSASALADDRRFLVLGSASLLASFPELGDADALLATTYDADLCPEPFDELTGVMLDEALGEIRAYFRRHGYHAEFPMRFVASQYTHWIHQIGTTSPAQARLVDQMQNKPTNTNII